MYNNINISPNFNKLPQYHIRVDNKLSRGPKPNPFYLYEMKKEGINQIIDLRNTVSISSTIEKIFCKIFHINYISFPFKHRASHLPNYDFFHKINEQILNNRGKTYIHCQKGKRRTGLCTAMYERENTNKTPKEIIDNMLNLGFYDIFNRNSTKFKRYQQLVSELISNYFT